MASSKKTIKTTSKRPVKSSKMSASKSSTGRLWIRRFFLLKLNKNAQLMVYYLILTLLMYFLISVFAIAFWEIGIGVELSHFQFMLGIYTTITLPTSVGMSVIFFVLLPTVIAIKALSDIRIRQFKNRGISLVYLSVWLFLLTSIFGLCHVGLKFFDVYDVNQRLKRTLLRFSYLYAQNDEKTVLELNDLHHKYRCCGVENASSWADIKNWMPNNELAVPHSCCKPEYGGPCYFQGLNGNYSRINVIESIYLRGCRKLLNRYFRNSVRPILFYLMFNFILELCIVFLLLVFVQNFDINTSPMRKRLKTAGRRKKLLVFLKDIPGKRASFAEICKTRKGSKQVAAGGQSKKISFNTGYRFQTKTNKYPIGRAIKERNKERRSSDV